MNYTITDNPYRNINTVISTRGVVTDAKVAKLNNSSKKPALVRHWEELKKEMITSIPVVDAPKDYSALLNNMGITPVNYGNNVVSSGAKKLRVNRIVIEKSRNVFNSSKKVDVIPQKLETFSPKPVENISKPLDTFMPNVESVHEDTQGKHVRTMEETIRVVSGGFDNNSSQVNNTPTYSTRTEKNNIAEMNNKIDVKQESKSPDMDLYNNLLHNANVNDDVSRQLQGARNQLSIEKEESRKLAEQYGEAVKELAKLKEDIEVTKKQKEQKAKEELSMTLKSIENLQRENLERTSDLSSIQSEIARLKAEKQAIESSGIE